MKYIKRFENNSINQQPFWLSKSDYLYLSDELAKKIAPNFKNRKGKYNQSFIDKELNNQKIFFNDARAIDEKGYLKVRWIFLDSKVAWDHNTYSMSLSLYRGNDRNLSSGIFHYYITGNSGDHEMHGKNMKRGTRDCNLNFIIKYYPIVKYIKNFYNTFKTSDQKFFDIIKNAIIKNNSLVQYGVPEELLNDEDVDYLVTAWKYNI